jgi:atlastin
MFFQRLLFLIRDWPNADQYDYGYEASQDYLENEVLETKVTHTRDMKELRQSLRDSFESIDCFLIPHPGPEIVNDKDFDGRWAELNKDFVSNLKQMISTEFSPENLLKKRVAGEEVTAQMLFDAIKGFQEILNSPEVPSGRSMYNLFATGHLENLISTLFNEYKNSMKEKSKTVKNVEELEKVHGLAVSDLKTKYDNTKKIGDTKLHQKYYKMLEQKIEESFETAKLLTTTNTKLNELKAKVQESEKREEKIREDYEKLAANTNKRLEELQAENRERSKRSKR